MLHFVEYDDDTRRPRELPYNRLTRCFVSHRMVVQAAVASVQGAHALLLQLEQKKSVDYGDLSYPSSRTTEIRRLVRELLRRRDEETARRIAHLNHLLKRRLRRIAKHHGLNPGMCLPEGDAD